MRLLLTFTAEACSCFSLRLSSSALLDMEDCSWLLSSRCLLFSSFRCCTVFCNSMMVWAGRDKSEQMNANTAHCYSRTKPRCSWCCGRCIRIRFPSGGCWSVVIIIKAWQNLQAFTNSLSPAFVPSLDCTSFPTPSVAAPFQTSIWTSWNN